MFGWVRGESVGAGLPVSLIGCADPGEPAPTRIMLVYPDMILPTKIT
ncbi:MAG: hypothetical protein RLZZ338_3330 [Cyanobacteriota bacterium]|jgi:hypothetical protein